MTKIEGYIEDIKHKCSPKGPSDWENWVFVVNSQSYGTFDKKLASFKVGTFVGLDYEESGKFKNITMMVEKPIADEPPKELDMPTKNIDKVEVFKLAVSAWNKVMISSDVGYKDTKEAIEKYPDHVREIYQKFLAWLE